jgi:hypothetical protein
MHTSIREHEDILTHLLRGDEALAEEAARAHQRSALRDLLLELARHSESPIMALAPSTGRPAVAARASGHRH